MPAQKTEIQSPDSLRNLAKQITQAASALTQVAADMEDDGFLTLVVANDFQREQAIEFLDSYCGAARKALTKARTDRGDFASPKRSGTGSTARRAGK